MTEEKIKELSRINNPVAKEAAEFLRKILKSPYYESYISCYVQTEFWNGELKISPTTINSDKDDPSFMRAHKFVTTQADILENLDTLRSKLLPSEMLQAEVESTSLLDEARLKMKERTRFITEDEI